jgi:aspartyl-tRNA(Asn)/glutamyl-tRNA(Gln) amidotransferase subunit C
MPITREQVAQVARLARIQLDPAAVEQLTTQLDSILSYMEQLNTLDTTDTPVTTHVLPMGNVFRPDIPLPCLSPAETLQNAPESANGSFKVPKVI